MVSYGPEGLWNIAKKRMLERQRELYPKKMVINCWNVELCMKKTFAAGGHKRMWKNSKAEMERLNEDKKNAKVGKEKW